MLLLGLRISGVAKGVHRVVFGKDVIPEGLVNLEEADFAGVGFTVLQKGRCFDVVALLQRALTPSGAEGHGPSPPLFSHKDSSPLRWRRRRSGLE